MQDINIFTARDLRNRSGELLKDAEVGQISLITKHGRPAILAVPFDEYLLSHGVHRSLALHLFETHRVTMAQAAKMAKLSLEEFIGLLGETGVPAVDYPADELVEEVQVAL